jgi:hypothetical protein
MVRENQDPPRESKGFDNDQGVQLNKELDDAGKGTYETQFPEGEPNKQPIDIRGDDEPEKKG